MMWRDLERRLQGERLDRWRMRRANGYVIDRRFFLVALGLIVVLGFVGWWQMDFSSYRWVYWCDGPLPCRNPWMNDFGYCESSHIEFCSPAVIMPGQVIGDVPPWILRHLFSIGVGLTLAAFALNHATHNKAWHPATCWLCRRRWP